MNQQNFSQQRKYAFSFIHHLLQSPQKLWAPEIGEEKKLEELAQELSDEWETLRESLDEYQHLEAYPLTREICLNALLLQKEIHKEIQTNLKSWTMERLPKVNLSVLILGISELKLKKQTPVKVIISEALSLAAEYGDQKSSSFVNAILDKIAKQMELL